MVLHIWGPFNAYFGKNYIKDRYILHIRFSLLKSPKLNYLLLLHFLRISPRAFLRNMKMNSIFNFVNIEHLFSDVFVFSS